MMLTVSMATTDDDHEDNNGDRHNDDDNDGGDNDLDMHIDNGDWWTMATLVPGGAREDQRR